jgi:hypothetical protein
MVPTLRHVLVIGVDGVRFDLLGPEVTLVIWGFTRNGFLTPVPVDETTPPLALAEDGGPLFAEATRREFVAVREVSLEAWDAADEAVTSLAASILTGEGPRLSFVYLGAVDVVGHVLGAGSAYREAARAADRRVGRLLSAVRSRPSVADEAWTTVVVTDHGHLDQGGHGGREPEVAAGSGCAPRPRRTR